MEPDADIMAAWLRNAGYPIEVDDAVLANECVRLRIDIAGETAAYWWAGWSPHIAKTLVFHGCAAPEFIGRWFDISVFHRIMVFAELMDADLLMTAPQGKHAARLGRLYRRLGFIEPIPGEFLIRV